MQVCTSLQTDNHAGTPPLGDGKGCKCNLSMDIVVLVGQIGGTRRKLLSEQERVMLGHTGDNKKQRSITTATHSKNWSDRETDCT